MKSECESCSVTVLKSSAGMANAITSRQQARGSIQRKHDAAAPMLVK